MTQTDVSTTRTQLFEQTLVVTVVEAHQVFVQVSCFIQLNVRLRRLYDLLLDVRSGQEDDAC